MPYPTVDHHLARLALACLLAAAPPAARAASPAEPGEDRSADSDAAVETAGTAEPTEPSEPTAIFEQLLVVGSAERAQGIPGSAHVVTRENLERQAYADVHRILRQVPGVNIQEEDGYGLRPNIGIRGTGVERSQKVTLLEDGVLIAPAPYAAPSAYYSPTAGRMEGFEVRKGSSAIRQGPYTNGGALNYLSSSIPDRFSGRVDLAAGEDAVGRVNARAGAAGDTFGWLVETYQLETDGFKRLDGGGGTGFDLEDYLAKVRVNSPPGSRLYQALELKLGRTEQDGDETYLGLTREDFDRAPYRRYAASAGDNISSRHEQAQLSYFVEPRDGVSLTATAYRNDFFRNWFKLEKVDGIGVSAVLADPAAFPERLAILRGDADSAPGALAVRNNRRDYYSRGVQAVLAWELGAGRDAHQLEIGLRYHEDQEDRFQEEDLFQMVGGRRVLTALGPPGSQANRIADAEALALFVQDTFRAGRWTLTPGVRVEAIDLGRRDFGTADPGRTGADVGVRANDLTEVIPGIGASYRLDDFSTLVFGVHRGFSPPSPGSSDEVDAEESVNYELGWRRQGRAASAELVGFFNDYDNLLGNDTLSTGGAGTGDQFNGGAVRVAGLEAGLAFDLARRRAAGPRLPLRLGYTYTASEFGSSFATTFADWAPRVERGDELPYIPEHQLYAGLSVEGGRWSVHLDAHYSSEMRTRSGSGAVPADESIDARLLADLRTELRLRDGVGLWAQVLNATDEVYVAARRPAGLRPGRPRAALVGLTFDFAR